MGDGLSTCAIMAGKCPRARKRRASCPAGHARIPDHAGRRPTRDRSERAANDNQSVSGGVGERKPYPRCPGRADQVYPELLGSLEREVFGPGHQAGLRQPSQSRAMAWHIRFTLRERLQKFGLSKAIKSE